MFWASFWECATFQNGHSVLLVRSGRVRVRNAWKVSEGARVEKVLGTITLTHLASLGELATEKGSWSESVG